jgi:hypothetical protein
VTAESFSARLDNARRTRSSRCATKLSQLAQGEHKR